MADYAMVQQQDGVVANTIVWDGNTDPATGGWEPPAGFDMIEITEATGPAGPGSTWDGTSFQPREEPPT